MKLVVWVLSLNFLHVFTLFVIDIHKNMLISLFPTPFGHFQFLGSAGQIPKLILTLCLLQGISIIMFIPLSYFTTLWNCSCAASYIALQNLNNYMRIILHCPIILRNWDYTCVELSAYKFESAIGEYLRDKSTTGQLVSSGDTLLPCYAAVSPACSAIQNISLLFVCSEA